MLSEASWRLFYVLAQTLIKLKHNHVSNLTPHFVGVSEEYLARGSLNLAYRVLHFIGGPPESELPD